MKVLITGGTGFIGTALCKNLLKSGVERIVSFSRRWDDAEKLKKRFNDPRLRCINGDVGNFYELASAMKGMTHVIHAAAYKSVPSAEYNPFECVRVNVLGTEHVIKAAIANKVRKVMFISSDKACAAVNLYGRTKALGESMITNANNLTSHTRFATARYGNVIGSTGSVVPLFEKMIADGHRKMPLTLPHMTRFWFKQEDAVKFVLYSLKEMRGGEVFIPKLKSSTMWDVVSALSIKHKVDLTTRTTGIRPGEKIHEMMIADDEASRTMYIGDAYVICPFSHEWDANWSVNGAKATIERYDSHGAARLEPRELAEII